MVLKQLSDLLDILKKQEFIYRFKKINKGVKWDGMKMDSCQIYIHLTNRCNLKCTYCYNGYFREDPKEISLEDFKIIIDRLIHFANSITLTGGEPFLHKNIIEIIMYIKYKKEKVYLDIITNGVADIEQRINGDVGVLNNLDAIKLSCDKLNGTQKERIGFNVDKFKQNIRYLLMNIPPEKLEISSVYTRHLEDDILKVKAYSDENCIKHSTVVRIPTDLSNKKIEKTPLPDDLVKLNAKVNSVPESNSINNEKRALHKFITCGAANTVYSIDVMGDVFPCQSFHFPEMNLGNILQSEFCQIYMSESAIKVRNHTVDDTDLCSSCKLKWICGGGCKADTYKLQGSMDHFPEFMHPYYERSAINALENITFE